MPDLIQLTNAADIVTRALVNLEGDRQRPKVPAGWKIITPRHPERVMGEVVQRVAWPRFLIWWLYLRSQRPTRDSFERAIYQARERLARRVTRAAGDVPNPDDSSNMSDLTAEEKALVIGDIAESLVMSDWLGGTSDAETLQALETYWAQLAGQLAGQQFIDAAGITGSFNLYDPRFFDYILNNTGALVTRIDATTREQLSWELYKLLGGISGQAPLGMDSLAPKLMQAMWDTYDNALAGMSLKRAMMIALTETARAEEFGNFVSMLQMGVQQKIWVITAGACIYCESDAEQGPIPILDMFPSGHMTAPGHPKCRCSVCSALASTYDPSQWTPNFDLANQLLDSPDIAFWPAVPESLRLSLPHAIRADISQKRANQVGEAAAALANSIGSSIGIDASLGIDDVMKQFQRTRPSDGYLTSHEQQLVTQFKRAIR